MSPRSCLGGSGVQVFARTFRQIEIECGPSSDFGVEADASVMLINDHFADTETQPGAASTAPVGPIGLRKPLEYLTAKVFRDSWSAIRD